MTYPQHPAPCFRPPYEADQFSQPKILKWTLRSIDIGFLRQDGERGTATDICPEWARMIANGDIRCDLGLRAILAAYHNLFVLSEPKQITA